MCPRHKSHDDHVRRPSNRSFVAVEPQLLLRLNRRFFNETELVVVVPGSCGWSALLLWRGGSRSISGVWPWYSFGIFVFCIATVESNLLEERGYSCPDQRHCSFTKYHLPPVMECDRGDDQFRAIVSTRGQIVQSGQSLAGQDTRHVNAGKLFQHTLQPICPSPSAHVIRRYRAARNVQSNLVCTPRNRTMNRGQTRTTTRQQPSAP